MSETRPRYWRPCPFFCPESPDHFRSWALLMLEAHSIDGPVSIDLPESTPLPRGTWDFKNASIIVTAPAAELTVAAVVGRRVHYAGCLTWFRRGTRTTVFAGFAACCSGIKADGIRRSGNSTFERTHVTCAPCRVRIMWAEDDERGRHCLANPRGTPL